ncbi:sodium:proton antiporter, partial [Vibrio parahaemolyticus]|nr:sodium:proton antiporter [Vibrio parahaemolyticus]
VAIVVASLVSVLMLKFSWAEIEKGAIETIQMSMQAILILMVIGTVVGSWILSGTVPAMIYYGLKILSPGIFLVATTLICSVVSLATGSSWTTAGTVGVALIGVGRGLGIPVEIVAGAIVSGAYFGDKLSPLSDTTNLAPAMAGSTLFEHLRYMLF